MRLREYMRMEPIGYLRKQRIAFTKNETSQGTDLLWMRLAEAPWGRTIEYLLQACLHDSRLRRHVFHESGFIGRASRSIEGIDLMRSSNVVCETTAGWVDSESSRS